MVTKSGNTEYLLLTRALIVHAVGMILLVVSYKMEWLQKVILTGPVPKFQTLNL